MSGAKAGKAYVLALSWSLLYMASPPSVLTWSSLNSCHRTCEICDRLLCQDSKKSLLAPRFQVEDAIFVGVELLEDLTKNGSPKLLQHAAPARLASLLGGLAERTLLCIAVLLKDAPLYP